MSHKVKLDHCYPLSDNLTAAPVSVEPPLLPADFPSELLSDEQLEAIQDWWGDWQQESLRHLRHLLTVRPPAEDNQPAPPNLANLQLRCVVLCHILGLHPAAERSLPTLAAELGVSMRKLTTLKGCMLRAMVRDRRRQSERLPNTQLATLMAAYPLLDWAAREGERPVIVVPFRGRLPYCSQFELCAAIAAEPGISATLTITSRKADALRITFHSGNKRKHRKQ